MPITREQVLALPTYHVGPDDEMVENRHGTGDYLERADVLALLDTAGAPEVSEAMPEVRWTEDGDLVHPIPHTPDRTLTGDFALAWLAEAFANQTHGNYGGETLYRRAGLGRRVRVTVEPITAALSASRGGAKPASRPTTGEPK